MAAPGDAEWVRVASLDQVPPGRLFWAQVGRDEIVVVNLDGELFALDNLCLHAGGPLDKGQLQDGCIRCPWHGWTWDPRTGRAVWPPVNWRVRRYPVKVEGRDIYVGRSPR